MGAQKGAHEHVFFFISFIFNLLCCVFSPAFAPKAYKWTSTEVFFISKIQKLPTFLG